MRTWILRFQTFLLLALAGAPTFGCGSHRERGPAEQDTVGPICPACGPSTGGETGDFGGSQIDCRPYQHEVPVEADEAAMTALAELEHRLSQSIDEAFSWRVFGDRDLAQDELSASGYQPETRVRGSVVRIGAPVFYKREACPEGDVCEACWSQIEAEVRVEFTTDDGAVQGTSVGTVVHAVAGATEPASLRAYFNSSLDLRDVRGTLRIGMPSSARPHGRLQFWGWLLHDGTRGGADIAIEHDQARGHAGLWNLDGSFFFPLHGSFGDGEP